MRWIVVVGCGVACHAGSPGDDAAADTGIAIDPIGPIVARCADEGPDAPVEPRILPVPSTFEDAPLEVYLPDGLRGVVFYFYGSDEVTEWNGPEQTAFANQMFDAGIGYVAYSKADARRGASWDKGSTDFGQNEDLARLERLRTELVATTALNDDTPILSVGFSDGAAFSVFFATQMSQQRGWPIAAVLVHNSSAGGVDLPDMPIWATASSFDDDFVRSGAEELAADQTARGFPASFTLVAERPITPEVLLRHAEWDAKKADEMHQDLVDFGLVDAAGTRLVDPADIEQALAAYVDQSLARGVAVSAERARVVWATHRYSALYTKDECEFALSALGL